MATIDIGKIKQVWRGTYAGGTAYTPDDVVEYTDNGILSSYICIANTTGNNPSSSGTAHGSWNYLAKGGAAGTDLTSTLSARGDIVFKGASALTRLPKGTAGYYLKQGANDPEWGVVEAGGGLQSIQSFASTGSYTWTKPSGINKVKVIVTGGGGGAMVSGAGSTAGGGAGGTAIKIVDVSSISTVSVTVGTGSTGSTDQNSPSAQGGTSSFGSHCSATGGTGGTQGSSHSGGSDYSGGEGGVGTSGNINITGGATFRTGGLNMQSIGGNSFWGGGGRGSNNGVNTNGSNGGGGGCGYSNNPGTGGNGVVYVEEYK